MTSSRHPIPFFDANTVQEQQYKEALKQQLLREREALKLYEPLPFQESFHKATAKEVVLQKGNRAGGSVAGFVEVARAVTGQDPYNKYPKEGGTAICLGYGENHIGRVIYRYLFQPGAFKIIKDNGKWRVYRPWEDSAREKEAKPAPPLIPSRYVVPKSMCWEKKAGKVFSRVEFTTGWVLYAGNSAGDPSQFQGFNVDLYHIDEDLATDGWYQEALGRVAAVDGKIRWTALPHSRNHELIDLIQRAEDAAEQQGPDAANVQCIKASIFDNKFLPKKSVDETAAAWKAQGEEVFRKRAMGELVVDSIKMYPTFNKFVHNAMRDDDGRSEVQKVITENHGIPPKEWTHYLFLDPGHTVCAALLLATPPSSIGRQTVVYDELYIQGATAKMFGQAAKGKLKDRIWQEFRADFHGLRLTSLAGESTFQHYTKALEENDLKCEAFGRSFGAGSDNIEGREEALRSWLGCGDDGHPNVYIVVNRCTHLCWEIERFKKMFANIGGKQMPTDKGNRRFNTHAVECLEMAAAHGCKFVPQRRQMVSGSWIDQHLEHESRMREQARRNAQIFGAGSDDGIYLG